jgi:hypothetical protein
MYNFHGIYRYSPRYATNWRSVVALIIGVTPPLPGFINSVSLNTINVSEGGKHLYVLYRAEFAGSLANRGTALPSVTSTHLSAPACSITFLRSSSRTLKVSWITPLRAKISSLRMTRRRSCQVSGSPTRVFSISSVQERTAKAAYEVAEP